MTRQNNRVTVQAPSTSGNRYTTVQTLGSSTSSEQLAPGDVQWAVLDRGSTLPDAIVVSTGSNAVLVYHTTAIVNGVPVFASAPQRYFVGTAPASVTVADINGDGVPDMLIADQGSNDVSILFGSYTASGNWVGTPGPRLKSGGDGPIAVSVSVVDGDRFPDLVVFNGGSGTVTLLPGVGYGFFDDQDPRTLFNLGGAVIQAPTFTGGSGVGYVVTADGDLVRFDLNNPAAGARVVFSGQPIEAAQALPSGQVVVAFTSGAVSLLDPQGNGLIVESEFQSQGGTPASPSAIEVVNKSSGHYDVLVSSQGSDTLFVFAPGGATAGTISSPGSDSLSSPFGASLASSSSASSSVVLAASVITTSSSQTAASTSSSSSSSSSSVSVSAAPTVGLSLGTFSSLSSGSSRGNGGAVLVPVEGNTYMNVPILEFGSENEAGAGSDEERMPWLSTRHPIGDTSPLMRFVIGLDAALKDYPGTNGDPLLLRSGAFPDPWSEDLFFPHLPVQPPVLVPNRDAPKGIDNPPAVRPASSRNSTTEDQAVRGFFGNPGGDEPAVRPSVRLAHLNAGLEVLTGLLAAIALTSIPDQYVPSSRKSPRPWSRRRAEAIGNRRLDRFSREDD